MCGKTLRLNVRLNVRVVIHKGMNAMLVLSRSRDEKVMIGNDIVITIVDVRDGKVRLGFDAPRNVPIHREEVFHAINREAHGGRNA